MLKFDNLYKLLIEEVLDTAKLSVAQQRLLRDQNLNNNPYFDELRKEFNQLSDEVIKFNNRDNFKKRLKRTLNRILDHKGIQSSFLNPILQGNRNRTIFTFLLTHLNNSIQFDELQKNVMDLKIVLENVIEKIKKQYPSEISNAVNENEEKAINKVSGKLSTLDDTIKDKFIKQVLDLTKIGKQSSTSTGRGQLLLTLLINGATFTGSDDIKINEKNYNIKFLDREDGALISIPQEQLNDFQSDKNQIFFNTNENIYENLIRKILQKNTYNVQGYILILNTNTGLKFRVLNTSEIIEKPLKYLMSIKFNNTGNTRSGFYFRNDDISFERLPKNNGNI